MARLRFMKRIKLIPTEEVRGSNNSVSFTLDPVLIKEGDNIRIVAKAKICSSSLPRFTYAMGTVSKIKDKTVTVTVEEKQLSPHYSYEVEAPKKHNKAMSVLYN